MATRRHGEACALSAQCNVCPNCGGNFVHRPIRPRAMPTKHPASTQRREPHVDEPTHAAFIDRDHATPPGER
ncbi:DUF1272 domain-containing protein [Paraburkholderia sp. GAS41]|uniref:DUF1272 domain-containing protein n=1 Tax=Paraburkholderia sp. GAS41 TaxID=3035134 RepID=UPI003D1AE7BF